MKARIETCSWCRCPQAVISGKVIAHEELLRQGRCIGSFRRSIEARDKDRRSRRSKKIAGVEAVRGEAAVLLDALLSGRDVGERDFDYANLRRLAGNAYRLHTERLLPAHGTHWVSGRKYHDLYCVYCGHLVTTIRVGYWTQLTVAERTALVEGHALICALQMLAGIRVPVARGTKYRDPSHELLSIDVLTSVPLELSKACPKCEAPRGLPCVGVKRGEGLRRCDRPHEERVT